MNPGQFACSQFSTTLERGEMGVSELKQHNVVIEYSFKNLVVKYTFYCLTVV